MSRDQFEKMEKKMKEMMEKGSEKGGHSISVQKVGNETTVDVSGYVSDEEINRLKKKYPDADIQVEGESQIGGRGNGRSPQTAYKGGSRRRFYEEHLHSITSWNG